MRKRKNRQERNPSQSVNSQVISSSPVTTVENEGACSLSSYPLPYSSKLVNVCAEKREIWDAIVAFIQVESAWKKRMPILKSEKEKLCQEYEEVMKAYRGKIEEHTKEGAICCKKSEENQTNLKEWSCDELERLKKIYDKKKENYEKKEELVYGLEDDFQEKKCTIIHCMIMFCQEAFSFLEKFTLDIPGKLQKKQKLTWLSFKEIVEKESHFVRLTIPIRRLHSALNYFAIYQDGVEDFSKIFNFSKASTSSDNYYKECVAIADELVDQLSVLKKRIHRENASFNLPAIEEFLKIYIPKKTLPKFSELVGLWAYFFSSVLVQFIELKPTTTNLEYLKNFVQFDQAAYFSFQEVNFSDINTRLKQLEDGLCANKQGPLSVNNTLFLGSLDTDIISLEPKLAIAEKTIKQQISFNLANYINILNKENLSKLYEMLNEENKSGLLKIDHPHVKPSNETNVIQNFYHFISRENAHTILSERLNFLFSSEIKSMAGSTPIVNLEALTMGDFVNLSYFTYSVFNFYESTSKLNQFEEKVRQSKRENLDVYFNSKQKGLEKNASDIDKKISDFLKMKNPNKGIGKAILEEIDLFISSIESLKQTLEKSKSLQLINDSLIESYEQIINPLQGKCEKYVDEKKVIGNHMSMAIKKPELVMQGLKPPIAADLDKSNQEFSNICLRLIEELHKQLTQNIKLLGQKSPDVHKLSTSIGQTKGLLQSLCKELNTYSETNYLEFTSGLEIILQAVENSTNKSAKPDEVESLSEIIKKCAEIKDNIIKLILAETDQYQKNNKKVKEILQFSVNKNSSPKFVKQVSAIKKDYTDLFMQFSDTIDLINLTVKEEAKTEIMRLYFAYGDACHYKDALGKWVINASANKPQVASTSPKQGSNLGSKPEIEVKYSDAELFYKQIMDFTEWTKNWETSKTEEGEGYSSLLGLFTMVGRSTLACLSSDYSAQLTSHQNVLKEKKSEIASLLSLSYLDKEYKKPLQDCSVTLNDYLERIESCFQQLELIKQQEINPIHPETEEDNFIETVSNAFNPSVAYLTAMLAYNQSVDKLLDKRDKLSTLLTQLITQSASHSHGVISPVDILNGALSNNPEFSKQASAINRYRFEVISKWNDKEEVKRNLYQILDYPTARQFSSRIDPWGVNNQEPPIIASLRDEIAKDNVVTYVYPLFVQVSPPVFIANVHQAFFQTEVSYETSDMIPSCSNLYLK